MINLISLSDPEHKKKCQAITPSLLTLPPGGYIKKYWVGKAGLGYPTNPLSYISYGSRVRISLLLE
jgi:hypothetical protein